MSGEITFDSDAAMNPDYTFYDIDPNSGQFHVRSNTITLNIHILIMKRKLTQVMVNISAKTCIKKPSTSHLKQVNTKMDNDILSLKIQILDWDKHKTVARLSALMGSQTSLLDNCQTSNGNTNDKIKAFHKPFILSYCDFCIC